MCVKGKVKVIKKISDPFFYDKIIFVEPVGVREGEAHSEG